MYRLKEFVYPLRLAICQAQLNTKKAMLLQSSPNAEVAERRINSSIVTII